LLYCWRTAAAGFWTSFSFAPCPCGSTRPLTFFSPPRPPEEQFTHAITLFLFLATWHSSTRPFPIPSSEVDGMNVIYARVPFLFSEVGPRFSSPTMPFSNIFCFFPRGSTLMALFFPSRSRQRAASGSFFFFFLDGFRF